MSDRKFDLILYGATGFTGRQALAYLQRYAEAMVRWAVAGRDGDGRRVVNGAVNGCEPASRSMAAAWYRRTISAVLSCAWLDTSVRSPWAGSL